MRARHIVVGVALLLAGYGVGVAQQKSSHLALQDYIDIQQLYANYANAWDYGDAEGYAGMFTPDGVFIRSGKNGYTVTGGKQIAEWNRKAHEGQNGVPTGRHWNSNLVINPSPGGANASVYLMVVSVGGGNPPRPSLSGRYDDQLVKTAAGWRFKQRFMRGDDGGRPEPPPPGQLPRELQGSSK